MSFFKKYIRKVNQSFDILQIYAFFLLQHAATFQKRPHLSY
ncbi:hypothetical protein HMPREF1870_00148 [Bacteroidales bacterium KA00344]|nr:hypothetical protein HMPREF1870_00148 [Bacteroidales bacterium KA00344]